MKMSAFLYPVLILSLCGFCGTAAGKEFPQAAPKAPVNTVKLQLPPAIYAVPGVESCIYFDNVVLTVNPDNYVFDVNCPKGRNDQKRWRYIPAPGEKGVFDLELKVISDRGVEASGKTKLIVTPADAGKGKEIAVLVIGDSLTAAGYYPARIAALMSAGGHLRVKMLGTRGKEPGRHEGYGGWTWNSFLTRKHLTPAPGQKFTPRFLGSPFLVDGKISLAGYLKKHHEGRVPDFITIQLGVNDIFHAADENLEKQIETILGNADKLIAALHKDAPESVIGVGLVTPGARTQDGFGINYGSRQTRWQYKKKQHALNAAMLKKFADYPDKKVFLIPTNVNLDCENNFPVRKEPVSGADGRVQTVRQADGVHPALAGYKQMGDTFFCWIKSHLAK